MEILCSERSGLNFCAPSLSRLASQRHYNFGTRHTQEFVYMRRRSKLEASYRWPYPFRSSSASSSTCIASTGSSSKCCPVIAPDISAISACQSRAADARAARSSSSVLSSPSTSSTTCHPGWKFSRMYPASSNWIMNLRRRHRTPFPN